ncbi:MAG: hypothetical protein QXI84_08300 [Thermofilaceae archaeon]
MAAGVDEVRDGVADAEGQKSIKNTPCPSIANATAVRITVFPAAVQNYDCVKTLQTSV